MTTRDPTVITKLMILMISEKLYPPVDGVVEEDVEGEDVSEGPELGVVGEG